MSVLIEKKVIIMWRLHNDPFQIANKEQFIDKVYPRKIGSSISAVNALVTNGEELQFLMPDLLGVDPKSTSSNWDKLVRNYWDSLSVDVFSEGKDLDLSFVYNFEDTKREKFIKVLANKHKDITDDQSLADFVEGSKDGTPNVLDNEKFKYGTAVSNEHWLLYRYCVGLNGKGYKRVSNSMSTTEMSPDIDFYIFDETIANEARKKTFDTRRKAMSKYYEIVTKRDVVEQLLLVFRDSGNYKDEMDKDMRLEELATGRPDEFLRNLNDKNLILKAQIEQYIKVGILRRIAGTSLIVDNDQPDVIIGNNMAEAVTYFSPSNTKTNAAVTEYSLKYKSKTSKK